MNVLLLGSGGREHALAWKLAQSPKLSKLYIAPGNAGTSYAGENVSLSITDFDEVRDFVLKNSIGMVVVGPEEPLVNGIADYFKVNTELKDVIVIGPGREGARLEGSKDFAKMFMNLHSIPTARHRTFTSFQLDHAIAYLDQLAPPYVLKADGLAAGKGVSIHMSREEAEHQLRALLEEKQLGTASEKVVIEEYLQGIELSVFVLTDGSNYVVLPEAKDYKRIGEGDTGPNTGGMGAVSPVPFADKEFMRKVEDQVIRPTINGLKKDEIEYKGFIFIGLMNVNGNPHVIEYNVRMGDPETEVVMPRLQNDLLDLFIHTGRGTLSEVSIETDPRTAVTVMAVSGGYPGKYEKGKHISMGTKMNECLTFHAGTRLEDGKLVTGGGRVLAVTAFGGDIKSATEKAYRELTGITFDGIYYRKDIGLDLMKA